MKAMRAMKLIVRELIVDGGKPWRATGIAGLWAILGFALVGGFPVAAQEADASAQTNDVSAAEVLSQLSELVQAADLPQPEDMAPPNDLSPTNALPQTSAASPGGDRANRFIRPDSSNGSKGSNRSQSNDRRSRGRRPSNTKSDQSGGSGSARDYSSGSDRNQTTSASGTNNGPVVLNYAAFQLIVDRNIFDPNRYPRGPGAPRARQAPRSVDSLTLVGTMSYEKGTFAFFDGTSSDYKKALKLTDSIAGYKVATITPNSVKLASGSNEVTLKVGAQLRREEDGPWLLSGQSTPYAAIPASGSINAAASATAPGSDTTSGASESDILIRLMQKREKE
jgi:hypothetical protein